MWYTLEGQPVIAIWTLHDGTRFKTTNRDHIGEFLRNIKSQFKADFGVTPALVPSKDVFTEKSDAKTSDVYCTHDWFSAAEKNSYRMVKTNGRTCGAMCPGYRTKGYTSPCKSSKCHEVLRNDGKTLEAGLNAAKGASFAILEGWNDVREHAGYYRSSAWKGGKSQYINLVRKYANPTPSTLRLQAETADNFHDLTPGNSGKAYHNESLDVGAHVGSQGGWYVGWTEAGEHIEFPDIQLGCGVYRFTARCSSDAPGKALRLEVRHPGAQTAANTTVVIRNTGHLNNYEQHHLGEARLGAGVYNLRVAFETGGTNIDYLFVKRQSGC
jgi:hypothetical protein